MRTQATSTVAYCFYTDVSSSLSHAVLLVGGRVKSMNNLKRTATKQAARERELFFSGALRDVVAPYLEIEVFDRRQLPATAR